jgi:hypothetical protein
MLTTELIDLIKTIKRQKCESQHIEFKKAAKGTPHDRLRDLQL